MMIEQHVDELDIGMYIVDITTPKGKFHLAKVGWIESPKAIEYLKLKGVERVLIDTSKQRSGAINKKPPVQSRQQLFKEDVLKAKAVFDQSKEIQKKLFYDAENGNPLDLSSVQKITDESIDIIFKNPDALACVLNIRIKDEYLLEHSVAVAVLMTIFAFRMNIDKAIVKELAIGAFLHDVGKIKIPPAILDKPGKLTEEEFAIMKSHASHSIEIIKKTPNISALSLEVAALHHEKLNGEGYPNGVADKDISIYGRMISICDIFDALTSHRCYKEGYSQVKAFGILRALAESNQLDAKLVDSFIKCIGVYPVGSVVQLDSNRLAVVASRNPDDPIRPLVKPFYKLHPKQFEAANDIDLSTIRDEQIVKCVRVDDFDLNMALVMEFLADQG
ncbi:HD-GYP domain-containing protein [Psychromonas sp. MME2]|uniref:HD-GYP domain-containing protein n=1 Tax=unclassified Psychromonas TaxID=2614957 RepID=UPI00339BC162